MKKIISCMVFINMVLGGGLYGMEQNSQDAQKIDLASLIVIKKITAHAPTVVTQVYLDDQMAEKDGYLVLDKGATSDVVDDSTSSEKSVSRSPGIPATTELKGLPNQQKLPVPKIVVHGVSSVGDKGINPDAMDVESFPGGDDLSVHGQAIVEPSTLISTGAAHPGLNRAQRRRLEKKERTLAKHHAKK